MDPSRCGPGGWSGEGCWGGSNGGGFGGDDGYSGISDGDCFSAGASSPCGGFPSGGVGISIGLGSGGSRPAGTSPGTTSGISLSSTGTSSAASSSTFGGNGFQQGGAVAGPPLATVPTSAPVEWTIPDIAWRTGVDEFLTAGCWGSGVCEAVLAIGVAAVVLEGK